MSDWERYFWMAILGPVLFLQARYMRFVTPRLPKPEGACSGVEGSGPPVRLLVTGDSAAVGVGARSQDEALCGQLVRQLAQHHTVHWQLLAESGLETPGLLQLLEDAPSAPFDVVVISMGGNDVTALVPPRRWTQLQQHVAYVVARRFNPRLLVHSAAPPMHALTAIPQPLRWFFGRWAEEMNRHLARCLGGTPCRRVMLKHPDIPASEGLASDGFHPGPRGYAAWAEVLGQQIQQTLSKSG